MLVLRFSTCRTILPHVDHQKPSQPTRLRFVSGILPYKGRWATLRRQISSTFRLASGPRSLSTSPVPLANPPEPHRSPLGPFFEAACIVCQPESDSWKPMRLFSLIETVCRYLRHWFNQSFGAIGCSPNKFRP